MIRFTTAFKTTRPYRKSGSFRSPRTGRSIESSRAASNEPDFRYGRVVLNAVVNLITKIASSPFAALGRLSLQGEAEKSCSMWSSIRRVSACGK